MTTMDLIIPLIIEVDATDLDTVANNLMKKYNLTIRSISSIDRSFERALSISLFDTEEEVQSISSSLSEQYDWLCQTEENKEHSYIMLAAEIYGITIYIHSANSVQIYEVENDCPIIHLIKLRSKDGYYIYLGTERESVQNEVDHFDIWVDDQTDGQTSNSSINGNQIWSSNLSNDTRRFKSECSLNITIRKMISDGNCFFRSISDQLTQCQDNHVILRQLIVDFILDHRELFEISIDKENFSSWDQFIYRMHQCGTFADGIVVVASAMFLRRHIIIHQHEQRPLLFKSSYSVINHNQIHLAYNSKSLHYDSVWPCDDNKLHIDETECILT